MRRNRQAQPWSRDPAPGVAVVVASAAVIGLLLLTAAVLFFPAFQQIDERLSEVIRSIAFPGLESLARGLTFIGEIESMAVLTAVAAAWLLLRGMRAEAVLLGATMVLGTVAGILLKEVVGRARPGLEYARVPIAESYSFPSGHALAALLFFGVFAFLSLVVVRSVPVKFWAWFACTVMAFGVAVSRVYLGEHYLGDIVASWMLGSAFLMLAFGAYVLWETRMRER